MLGSQMDFRQRVRISVQRYWAAIDYARSSVRLKGFILNAAAKMTIPGASETDNSTPRHVDKHATSTNTPQLPRACGATRRFSAQASE